MGSEEFNSNLCIDFEAYALENWPVIEPILSRAHVTAEFAKSKLHLFHLDLLSKSGNDGYPKTKRQLAAAYERYLINSSAYEAKNPDAVKPATYVPYAPTPQTVIKERTPEQIAQDYKDGYDAICAVYEKLKKDPNYTIRYPRFRCELLIRKGIINTDIKTLDKKVEQEYLPRAKSLVANSLRAGFFAGQGGARSIIRAAKTLDDGGMPESVSSEVWSCAWEMALRKYFLTCIKNNIDLKQLIDNAK
jgi:hypothetical protein